MANPRKLYKNDNPPKLCACGHFLKGMISRQTGECGMCSSLRNRYWKANKKRLEMRG